jgi:hypothetical protein
MRPARIITTVLFAAAVAVTGCTARSTVHPSAQPATAPAVALPPPATSATSDATPPPSTVRATSSSGQATTNQPRWTTTPKAGSNNPRVPQDIPMLVGIRTARHDGYDRVVLQFRNALPNWQVGYVAQVTDDARGAPVAMAGRAFLRLVVNPAWGHDQSTPPYQLTYTGPATLTPRDPTLTQVRWVDEFEGYLTFGLGLTHKAGFRVLQLHQPARLVIDVAR